MAVIQLIHHAPGAPGLRILGLGPGLKPMQGLLELKTLLSKHAFWATDRNEKQLKAVLKGSKVIVSLWRDKRMVGFGRATTDGIYRAVLWDVVVAGDLQGQGLGRQVVKALLQAKEIKNVEKVYLMTTNSSDFYSQMGFRSVKEQKLLVKNKNDNDYSIS